MRRNNNRRNDRFDRKEEHKPTNKVINQFIIRREEPLLEFLLRNLNQSRNNVKTLLGKRHILVDGALVTQFDYLLQPKQTVHIMKDSVFAQATKIRKADLEILFEDEEFLVINKPSGLLSIASDNEMQNTAYRRAMDYVRESNKKNRIFVLHRLDKDTSGVLMFGKSKRVQDMMQKDWNKTVTSRGYMALVEGTFKEKEGTYRSYLSETSTHMMYTSNNKKTGELAITNYKVVKENKHYSLLEVHIDSGKKNQIRVQMKDNGHPIVGDEKYESNKNPIGRLGLHAFELEFIHPVNKKVYRFRANTPKIFNKVF